jgi:hypothetical protein
VEERFDSLPPAERARRYRARSAEALAQAKAMPAGDLRDQFVEIAIGWARLADHCEFLAGGGPDPYGTK